MDRVHRKAVRWIYKIPKLGSVTETMETHNILTLENRRETQDIVSKKNRVRTIQCQTRKLSHTTDNP